MIWLGVDPGINGALVLGKDHLMLDWWDMPTVVDGKRRSVDPFEIVDIMRRVRPDLIAIEHLRPRPKGSIAAFKLGYSMGACFTAAYASSAIVKRLAPEDWKGWWGFNVGDKDAPRQELLRRIPDAAWLRWVKDQDRADAYFIGYTAMLQHEAESVQ